MCASTVLPPVNYQDVLKGLFYPYQFLVLIQPYDVMIVN
jgi:hypothetical protein